MDEDNTYPEVTETTNQPQQIRKLAPEPQQGRTVHDWIRDMRMSPDVNKTTVGVETDQVTPELMLATSRKLLGISRREQESDPKDSLQFQRVYGPTDYFAEHIMRDSGKLGRNLLWKATNRGNLDFMPTAALDKHISDVFYDSKLANMVDGSSPLELMDASMKITRIGEGGVGDQDAAPTEMRLVQPSFMGFVDPARSVDSFRVGLDAYLSKHVKKGSDGKLYREMVNAHTGKKELVDSVTAAKSVVTTPEMMNAKTSHIYALGGKTGVRIVPKEQVDYFLPNTDEIFSTAANLVPMASGVKEMRLHMGCLHPATNLLYTDREGMTHMSQAQDVKGGDITVPSASRTGKAEQHIVRATIAKFPKNRSWFVKIVLLSGRTLITSKDHRWSIVDEDGNVSLIDAQRLKPGMHVLRSTFQDVPCRRTYVDGICIGPAIARLLGYAVLSLAQIDDGAVRFEIDRDFEKEVRQALDKLKAEDTRIYTRDGHRYVSVKGKFAQWLKDKIHVGADTRAVPPEMLSASPAMISEFLDGYTHDKTKVGIDGNEDYWIFSIANSSLRDQLAFLWMRIGTDTCYRDAISDGAMNLALQLIECDGFVGDCVRDVIKAVKNVPSYTIMVDVDVNDNLFAVASGIITHNSKYALQAVPLDEREPQLVRTLDQATGKDMPSIIGKYLGAQYAKKGGHVSAVRKDRIDVIYDDGTKGSVPLYRDYPMNAKGYIDNEPQVKAGQAFKAGDLLASSNYTDKHGLAAVGRPLRSAWVSWKGGTYEDAIVLSEDAAKKLTSTTMYPTAIDLDHTVSLGKKNYQLWKPGEYNKDQMATLDDDGVVKPGTVLHKGDPVVLAIQTTEPSPGTLGKRLFTDMSETWEHDKPGVVRDVVKTRKGVKVLTTVTAPVEVGDKLSNSYGAKGTVSQILPTDQMPQDKDGNPMDILFSPLSLISRTNPSQLHEALLGKVAHKTGKPEIMPVFDDRDIVEYVNNRLKQNRLKAEDDLVNPETGLPIPGVLNGYSYIYKLKHLSESKMAGRGTGTYSQDDTPTLGSDDGAKRYGTLEVSALAGHNVFGVLKDARLVRGQANTDFWRSLRMGQIPVMPGEPTIYKKFFAHLQGAGVNVRRTPKGVSVFSLTNGDVNELAGSRELKSRDTYEAKSFRPIDGGLFGQDVFGPNGDKWAYIQLDEPLPNPVMEEPLARLLNISDKDFQAIVSGQKEVDGMKSPSDMKARLAKMDLAKESADALREFKGASKSRKDAALKRYKAIELMRRAGENPAEYMLDRIPVLPPEYRPVTSANGLTMVADSNYLYAQMLDARDDMREAKDLPEEYQNEARANIYRKWKELTGLYDPESPKLQSKNVKGLLAWAIGGSGTSPKFSAFQRKVLGMSVDTVGRGVVTPDSRLKLNEVGMPVEMAFKVFAPFVERKLVQSGYTPIDAMKLTKSHDSKALAVLQDVMKTHPVQMNRAPTLHKLSIMGFWPKLVPGHALRVNPSINVPFNLDHDGNCIDYNSKIYLKISKSRLNEDTKVWYNISVARQRRDITNNGDYNMSIDKLQEVTLFNIDNPNTDEQFCRMKIGEFPRRGLATQDRNGAYIYNVSKGIEVLGCDPVTGQAGWYPVSRVTEEKNVHTVKVKAGNREVIVSDNESIAVFDNATGRLMKVAPKPDEPRLIPVLKKDIRPYGDYGDRDLGWLFGAFISDGWKTGYTIGYTKLEEVKRNEFIRIMRNYHDNFTVYTYEGHKGEGRLGDSIKIHLNSKSLVEWWDQWDFMDADAGTDDKRTALHKKIDGRMIQQGSEEFLWGLLSGLIDGDGSIVKNMATGKPRYTCRLSTSSPKLRDTLYELLWRLGIRYSATEIPPRNFSNTAYVIMPSAVDIRNNLDKLTCVGAKELQLINEWRHAEQAGDKQDQIPVTDAEAKALAPYLSPNSHGNIYSALHRSKNKKVLRCARYMLLDNAEFIKEHAPTLYDRAANTSTLWCAIDSVEDAGFRDVYDLEVEGAKVYATNNGIIVWDTMNLHVPVSDQARRETIERMFPERNLVAMRNRQIAYKPEKEYIQGLYVATRMKSSPDGRTRIFDSLDAAKQAQRDGIIDVDDPIIIRGK